MAKTINLFVGADTGGLEEATAAGGNFIVSKGNASILNKDSYHFRCTSTTTARSLDFNLFDWVADAGGGYIAAFDIEFTAWPTGTSLFCQISDVSDAIGLNVTNGGVVNLLDAAAGTLDSTAALSLNTKYRLEIYFQHTASANWEWWLSTSDGAFVSQGSGSAADLLGSGSLVDLVFWSATDSTFNYDLNNIVFQSGVTSSDGLGHAVEVICNASNGGSPTTGGDTLDTGSLWTEAQEIPITSADAEYLSGPKSGWVQADGTHANASPGPSGLSLTNIVAAKISVAPHNNSPSGVFGERLPPTSIAVQTNLTGAVTDIDEPPDSPDANWLTASGLSTLRVLFGTPTAAPNSVSEQFTAWVRRTNTGTYSQTLYPEATFTTALANSGGASALDCVDEDQNGFATSYLYPTADDQGISVCNFPTPSMTANPSGTQTIRIYCGKYKVGTGFDSGGGNPTINVQVSDSGGNITTTGGAQSVTANGWISWTFAASDLTDADGSSVKIVVTCAAVGGGPNKRNVAIDSIQWQAVAVSSAAYNLEVWENGSKVAGITGQTGNVTSTSGEMLTFTWDSAQLGTADGSQVELYLNQTSGSEYIEIGAVEWQSKNPATGQIYLGNSVDGVTVVGTTASAVSAALSFDDWGAYKEFYSENPAIVPSDSEYMRVGFGVTAGAGVADAHEGLLGMVLEAPNAGYDIHAVAVGRRQSPVNVSQAVHRAASW